MTARCTGRSLNRRDVMTGGVAGAVSMQLPLARAAARVRAAEPARFDIVGPDLHWSGRPVRLKGVAVGDPFYVRKDRDGSVSDFATIRDVWRANVVRLSLHPTHWRHDGKAAMERLGRDIAAARAASLFVILDWHAIGFPDRYTERPDLAWGLAPDAYESDFDLALSFWAEAARSFGRDRGIIFELWNEPVVDPQLWVDSGQHWPLLKATWGRLIEVIRRHSDAVVLASGERWAHDLTGVKHDRIDDHRLAYAWHCYPQEARGSPNGDWASGIDGLNGISPIVVTEWGFCPACGPELRGTAEDFGVPFTRDVLERLDLHSTAWCWSPGAAPAMLEQDWSTPNAYGRLVGNYLRHSGQQHAMGDAGWSMRGPLP